MMTNSIIRKLFFGAVFWLLVLTINIGRSHAAPYGGCSYSQGAYSVCATPTPGPTATPEVTLEATPEPSPSIEPSPTPSVTPSPAPESSASPDIIVTTPTDSPSLPAAIAKAATAIANTIRESATVGNTLLIGAAAAATFLPSALVAINSATTVAGGLSSGISALMAQLGFIIPAWQVKGRFKSKIVSSVDARGISGAVVSLYDARAYDRLVAQTKTDRFGQYGFLAAAGQYFLRIDHPKFKFPSGYINRGYRGHVITLDEESVINDEIFLDPTAPDTRLFRPYEIWLVTARLLHFPILIIGLLLSISYLVAYSALIGGILCLYYVALLSWELFHTKEAPSVLQVVDQHNQGVANAIVRLYNDQSQVIFAKVTSPTGKAFIMVPEGQYTAEVLIANTGSALTQTLHFPKGLLPKPTTLRINQQTTSQAEANPDTSPQPAY